MPPGSIQLARVLGIRVGANPSWFVVLFLMIYVLTGYFGDVLRGSDTEAFLVAVAAALLFFVSLVLHELGHAIVARRNGIAIAGIDLWFFGGIAKMTRDTESPGEEFRVAIAGPAVTAVIIGVCVGVSVAISRMGDFVDSAQLSDKTTTPALALLGWLAIINTALLLFNLVPALPLDGGRVARAIAWRVTGDRNRGTRFSGRAGQAFSYVLIGAGVFFLLRADPVTGVWCIILGLFLGQAARGFVAASRFSERLEGITVGDVMDDDPVAIPAETTVLNAHEDYFLRYHFSWFPTVDSAGRLVGVLREERVDGALAAGQPALAVHEVLDGEGDTIARVARDASLEALLGSEALRRLGALPVVDPQGILCGVVRIDDVRRALTAAVAGPFG